MEFSFKIWFEQESKGLVTFDFDCTLTKPQFIDDEWIEADPKQDGVEHSENHEIMRKYATQGYTIWIVTSRYDNLKQEVEDFVKKHNLPVSNIICTNGKDKGPILARIGSLIHHDDVDKSWEDPINIFKGKWIKIYHPVDGF